MSESVNYDSDKIFELTAQIQKALKPVYLSALRNNVDRELFSALVNRAVKHLVQGTNDL